MGMGIAKQNWPIEIIGEHFGGLMEYTFQKCAQLMLHICSRYVASCGQGYCHHKLNSYSPSAGSVTRNLIEYGSK